MSKTNQLPEDDRLGCSIPEAARFLKISRNFAYQMARSGELPVVKMGGRIIVSIPALKAKFAKAGAA